MKTIFFFMCFMITLVLLMMKMSHLLSFLVIYEILGVYFLLASLGVFLNLSYFYMFLFFLAFTVCESVVGLVLFVLYCRAYSKDHIHSLNLCKF